MGAGRPIRGKDIGTNKRTNSGASCKAEAHGSRAGATSPSVGALLDLHISHVQEGVPEVDGTCRQYILTHHDCINYGYSDSALCQHNSSG